MKQIQRIIFAVGLTFFLTAQVSSQEFRLETLDRGLVAVALQDSGVYLGWRFLGTEPDSIGFNVYRDDIKLNNEPVIKTTNYVDSSGSVSDTYHVIPVIGGVEQTSSNIAGVWNQNYLTVPLQRPTGGTTPSGDFTYNANDASVGDLDGDGDYEIVLKWDPSNSKDNSQEGHTGNIILDAYEMDGTHLWRLDLGVNIRAGAHYTPFLVYDLDGDGIAEIICRTAPGSKDGSGTFISDGPADSADHNADYRNISGYILSGPEYLTVFNGSDGSELVTNDLEPARGNVGDWGDTYGNRVDRFLAAIVHLGGENPSIIWARGIYEKTELAAWDLVEGELVLRWHFKTQEGYSDWEGMGSHNLSVGDVDGDNKDEIIYGNCAIDDDGTGLWTLRNSIGKATGDAMHLADIIPEKPGLEKWGCAEGSGPGSHLVDAASGEVLWLTDPGDVGRATAGDLVPDFLGMECWGGTDGLRSANNEYAGPYPSSTNHVVWWDGDLGRELLDATNIRKYGGDVLLLADGCSSNNGTKSNPCLQADLFGDWREEVIWRTSDNNNLRIYTTIDFTKHRIRTLMHDPVYRLAVAWQNASYNQPPHTSFYLGYEMFTPDSLWPPSKPRDIKAEAWADSVQIEWAANTELDLVGYSIFRGLSADSLILLEDVGLNTFYVDTNVVNDITYFYAVAAYDQDGNSSVYSEIVEATPTIRPSTPSGVDYRYDSNSILLIWASQDFDNISTVNIFRFLNPQSGFVLLSSQDKSTTTYIDANLNTGRSYTYQITVTDTSGKESFPTEKLSIIPRESFTMQAEDANYIGTIFVENNHIGYNGTAFVNFDGNNSGVEFTHIPGFGGGERVMIFRYALGNANRSGALVVNGNTSGLTMQGTGEWTNWVIDSIGINLNEGYDNTIRIETTGSDFGNLDEITIVLRALTSIEHNANESIPSRYELYPNYPNPFNPQTTVSFGLPEAASVNISVYDIEGRLVSTLVKENYHAGIHKIEFNAANLATGVYFVQSQMLSSNGQGAQYRFTRKIILLK